MRDRSPGIRMLFVGMIGAALIIPLFMVYALVSDRQHQARIAQDSISAGWAGPQIIAGPSLVIPFMEETVTTEMVDGKSVSRTVKRRAELYLAPETMRASAKIDPDIKTRAIYQSVIYTAGLSGKAEFVLPDDLSGLGVETDQLLLDEVEVRLGMSDPRGLQTDAKLSIAGETLALYPGKGPAASGGAGVHGSFDWSDREPISLDWSYSLRGSRSFSFVPRGKASEWNVSSQWQHPSFSGSFLPDADAVERSEDGFAANWSISNLALGQSMITMQDPGMPTIQSGSDNYYSPVIERTSPSDTSMAATIRLIEPVDLYSQVDRAVKYGFLFIGFTFLAFFMFDVVGGVKVASAEYLMTGAGLVLFFVLLLAFAEVVGFTIAYAIASAAIIGLLTAYSAAVLSSWKRARVIAGLLLGLYALLYVLLSLEAFSLLIGSVLLFIALAAVMYATRSIDWSAATGEEGLVEQTS
ncbi:MAG: cell envelope integrity protein CreD [Erythrobacter sp.]